MKVYLSQSANLVSIKLTKTVLLLLMLVFGNELIAQNFEKIGIKPDEIDKLPMNELSQKINQYWQDNAIQRGSGYKPFKRSEYFWMFRQTPDGKIPNMPEVYKEVQEFYNQSKSSKNSSPLANATWKEFGASGGYSFNTTGRVNAVAFHPSDANTMWLAASGGGLWKTTNQGNQWSSVSGTNFMSTGMSDIAISDKNPNLMLVATGDGDGPSGMGAYYSFGILRSSDAGANWTIIQPFGQILNQSAKVKIYRIIFVPNDANTAYFVSNQGFYKTNNGGSSWTQLLSGHYRDMEINAGNNDIIYLAKLTGNGVVLETYNTKSSSVSSTVTYNNVYRADIAVSKANKSYAYCILVTGNGGFSGMVRTTNNGSTWESRSTSSTVDVNPLNLYMTGNYAGGQGTYDLAIETSPTKADEVFIGGINVWKSTNGGTSFVPVSDGYNLLQGQIPYIHPDIHSIKFHPLNASKLFVGNDGGIVVSSDNGSSFNDLSSTLRITEHSRLSISASDPNFLICGAQDNGTKFNTTSNQWQYAIGGDGMDCLINPGNSKHIIASMQYGSILYSGNSGQSFESISLHSKTSGYGSQYPNYSNESAFWCAPIAVDFKNPSIVYAGHQSIWKSTNYGMSFSKTSGSTVTTSTYNYIKVAPSDGNYVYATYSDFPYPNNFGKGHLMRSTNGGNSWEEIWTHSSNGITSIEVDPKNAKRVFVTLSGYVAAEKVYEINDKTATNLTKNLPNLPINTIAYLANSNDNLFIGTDAGVFQKDKSSTNWNSYGTGLPPVIVNDIEISTKTGKLYAATYGRGIWEVPVIECNITQPVILKTGKDKLCVGDTVILEAISDQPNFTWSNGLKTKKITITTSGTFWVEVSDSKGCSSASERYEFTFVEPPKMKIASKNNLNFVCTGDSLEMNAAGFFQNVVWNNGTTGKKNFVKTAGTYWATGNDNSGSCFVQSNSLAIEERAKPKKPQISFEGLKLTANVIGEGLTFQWFKNGNILIGKTNSILELTESDFGKYNCVITANQCSISSDEYEIIPAFVEKQISGLNFNILPNPFTSLFVISGNSELDKTANFKVTDLLGRTVLEESHLLQNQFEISISTDKFEKGIYLMHIEIGNEKLVRKLIKE